MKRLLLNATLVALIPVFILGCSDEDDEPGTTGAPAGAGAGGSDALDRDELLGNVEVVRAMLEDAASDLDPMIIDDVDYEDGMLTVILAEGRDGQPAEEMESICEDISSAVDLPDLEVRVEKADGSTAAECSSSG